MAAFSSYLENKLLDLTLNGVSFVPTGDIWVALFTSGNGLDDNAPTGEVTNLGYGRVKIAVGEAVEFTTAVLGVAQNDAGISVGPATEDWDIVTHIALMDAVTGGNVYYWGKLPASTTVTNGNSFDLAVSELKIALT